MTQIERDIKNAWDRYWTAVGAGQPARALVEKDRAQRLERMARARKSTLTMLAAVDNLAVVGR